MHTDCFALLDDASTPGAGSRLYTGLAAVLQCAEGDGWPALLEGLQAALKRGQYAVSVCSYELGAHLLAMPPRPAGIDAPPLAQVLVFEHCTQLSQDDVQQWLDARVDTAPAGVADIHANVDQAEFTRALQRIHDYIVAGDTYQVNYTYRLRFDAFGSP